jgi:hypothetical protein
MARAIPVIDTILNSELKAQFNQRHTAHQVWEQLQIEIPGCDVGESTVRTYVRVRKTELGGAGKASSQIALLSRPPATIRTERSHGPCRRRAQSHCNDSPAGSSCETSFVRLLECDLIAIIGAH